MMVMGKLPSMYIYFKYIYFLMYISCDLYDVEIYNGIISGCALGWHIFLIKDFDFDNI